MSNQRIEISSVTHPSQILSKIAPIRGISEISKHTKFDQIVPEISAFQFCTETDVGYRILYNWYTKIYGILTVVLNHLNPKTRKLVILIYHFKAC